jgi:hypothetical protein
VQWTADSGVALVHLGGDGFGTGLYRIDLVDGAVE